MTKLSKEETQNMGPSPGLFSRDWLIETPHCLQFAQPHHSQVSPSESASKDIRGAGAQQSSSDGIAPCGALPMRPSLRTVSSSEKDQKGYLWAPVFSWNEEEWAGASVPRSTGVSVPLAGERRAGVHLQQSEHDAE